MSRLFLVLALMFGLVACGNDDGDESATSDPTAPSSIDAPGEVDSVPEDAPEVCELLTDEQITEVTGVSVTEIAGDDETCTWTLTESAAALGGPNEGGDASLEASFIDPEAFASFQASEEAGIEVVPVNDVGDEAFIVRRSGLPPSTLFVLDGDRALSLALANVLDGSNATEAALTELATEILRATP